MHSESARAYARYFAYLNLFMFAMLTLVLGANLAVLFIGWEGVGLCCYLLIGFYFEKEWCAAAGKKAFIVNRIGDFGFLLAIFWAFKVFGTVDFAGMQALDRRRIPGTYAAGGDPDRAAAVRGRDRQVGAAPALRLAAGRDGRSDAGVGADPRRHHGHRGRLHGRALQLHLPALADRDAGGGGGGRADGGVRGDASAWRRTTSRRCWRTRPSPSSGTCSWRRARARSRPAIFHVFTHAFFKACLFLGAGSVIHACAGEQDMRKMGGLAKHMPTTYWTFVVATLALAGIPPLAGLLLQGRDPGQGVRGRGRESQRLRRASTWCSGCSAWRGRS